LRPGIANVQCATNGIQFAFSPTGHISAEGKWELLAGDGSRIDGLQPVPRIEPYRLHQLPVEGFENIKHPPARIRAYAIEGDILAAGQDANKLISNWLPNTPGNKIVSRLMDPPTLGSAVDRHFREALLDVFGASMPKRFLNRSGVLRAP
jgi:hypothetical protein